MRITCSVGVLSWRFVRLAMSAVNSWRLGRLGTLHGENTMLRRPCLSSYCGLVREMNGVFRPYSPNPFSFFFLQALHGNCLVYQHYCSRYNSLQCAMTHYCAQPDIRLIHTETMAKISLQSSQSRVNRDRFTRSQNGSAPAFWLVGTAVRPLDAPPSLSSSFPPLIRGSHATHWLSWNH